MKFTRLVGCLGFIGTLLWSQGALCVPVYGGSAYVASDAGRTHTHQNAAFDSDSGTTTTGVITQSLADNHNFGAQAAATSAYASVGALGGKVQASSTSGSSPSAAQAFDDLSWYFDWKPTGAAGSTVKVQFSQLYEGSVVGSGSGYSGGTHSTTFVGGGLFGDFDFNALVNPGPFSILVSKVYDFTVGDVVRLSSRLTVAGRAELTSAVDVDAFNTSKWFIDVLTPGAGYNSADFLFPTLLAPPDPNPVPVPEPASLAMFGAALVVAAIGRFRPGFGLRRQRRWCSQGSGPRVQ
jgi:hypothetical protein